ncbi:hypothetical protein AAZX31_05G066400 [Glycine max]
MPCRRGRSPTPKSQRVFLVVLVVPLYHTPTPMSGCPCMTLLRSPLPSPSPALNVTNHPHPLPLHSRTRYETMNDHVMHLVLNYDLCNYHILN